MFKKFFRQPIKVPVAHVVTPQDIDSTVVWPERRRVPRAMPTPQIVEGDGGEADWALWLDAMQASEHESASATQPVKGV